MNLRPTGMHHVSALTNDIVRNHDFYTRVLGMRLVKRTVNQDDPGMYHLFYADGIGSPGSEMTFFDMPMAAREHPGNHSISRTTFRVGSAGALTYWSERLAAHGVPHGRPHERDGRDTLDFEDPHGLAAAFIAEDDAGDAAHPWHESEVPAEHQIRGLGPVVLTVPRLEPTGRFLTDVLNLRPAREYPHPEAPDAEIHVFEMGEGGPSAELHVAVRPELPRTRYGSGGVHHVALRVPDEEAYDAWAERLKSYGRPFHAVDRYYFRSLYVREPGGILIELATDGPGFSSDERIEDLGRSLALPPFLEPRRAVIEARLKPLG